MSFNKRLFAVDDFTPKRKNGKKNGSRNKNGNGRFRSPGFFSGLRGVGVQTDNQGLQVPELGEGFNTRFGRVGSGFVENVDTFKVGFKDVITGNGRTGEIIGTVGTGRKRGRPKGSGKGRRKGAVSSILSEGKKKKSKGIKIGKAVVGGSKGKTVAQLLGEKVIEKSDKKFRSGVSDIKRRAEGIPEGFERESISLGEGEGRALRVTQEGSGASFRPEPEEGGVTFAGRAEDFEEEEEQRAIDDAMNGEGVGEPLVEEEEALDEDFEEEEFGGVDDDDDIEDPFPKTKGGFVS